MVAEGVRVQICVTSPPYFGLRDYGCAGQIGIESSPAEYVEQMVNVFRAVRDVLAEDGTLWLNVGDSYAGRGRSGGMNSLTTSHSCVGERGWVPPAPGFKDKDLYGIPWRVAFALQSDGWYLRSDIIWHKPNPMPESVRDRPTKAHEYLFLLAKSERYYYNSDAIREEAEYPGEHGFLRGPVEDCDSDTITWRAKSQQTRKLAGVDSKTAGDDFRNRRSVWTIATQAFRGAHFACFPRALVQPCILAGSRPGDTVLDPFMGSGTTAQVASALGRAFIGCELNPDYVRLQDDLRLRNQNIGLL